MFEVERFKLRKLSELEVRRLSHFKISNRCTALDNLSDSEDINRAWENIKQNIKTSAKESLHLYETKQNKPWFNAEFLQL